MFADIDDKTAVSASRESSDRVVLYVIWSRSDVLPLAIEDAWALLAERYPTDARFLLFSTYEELRPRIANSDRPSAPSIPIPPRRVKVNTWTPTHFVSRVERVLETAGGRLNPEVRDLLAVAEDELHPLSEEDTARLDRIRSRVGARAGDASAAAKRLNRLRTDTVRELHEKTAGNKPIALRTPSESGASWKKAMAETNGPTSAYAATARMGIGDRIEHPKFGVGIVTAVEGGRATILFESGPRKLVCA
jgi:hypothetical protein